MLCRGKKKRKKNNKEKKRSNGKRRFFSGDKTLTIDISKNKKKEDITRGGCLTSMNIECLLKAEMFHIIFFSFAFFYDRYVIFLFLGLLP